MSKELLKKYGLYAKKSLGQNFLVDENAVQKIADYVDIEGGNIIEVGPGYGALTEKLVMKKPASLTLVELDSDMVDILQDRKLSETLVIKHMDVLDYHPEFTDYSVIANIPYYITSPILRHFLYDVAQAPDQMLILMQKDVGDKILGKGKNKSSVLSLFIAKKCYVEEVLFVPRQSFYPAPKVESSVLYFQTHSDYDGIDDGAFLSIIKKGFLAPRKKLIKNLGQAGYDAQKLLVLFAELGIDASVRGEDLDVGQWCELVRKL